MFKGRSKTNIFFIVLQSVLTVFLLISGIVNTEFRWMFIIAFVCMAWGVHVFWTEPEEVNKTNTRNEVFDLRLRRLKERLSNETNPVRRARIRSQIMEVRLRRDK